MENLVFNRTQADVDRVKALAAKGWANMTPAEQNEWLGVDPQGNVIETACTRGAYNARDLNRVEAAVKEIASQLGLNLTVKTNWTVNDVPRVADMNRFLGNLQSIKNARPTASVVALPTSMARLTWQGANAIEQFLTDVYFNSDSLVLTYDDEGNVFISSSSLSAIPSDGDAVVMDGAITVTADDDGNVTIT